MFGEYIRPNDQQLLGFAKDILTTTLRICSSRINCLVKFRSLCVALRSVEEQ